MTLLLVRPYEIVLAWMNDFHHTRASIRPADADAITTIGAPDLAAVLAVKPGTIVKLHNTVTAIRNHRVWLTNEYEHNGLRAAGSEIIDRLFDLLHGRA